MKRLLLLVSIAGCAGQADSASPGGGNVSFGGQQDIGEFRGILEAGQIPGPQTLDANGFFNEHYVAPPTDCTTTLCITPGVSVGRDWLTGAHQATLQIAVNTNVDPTTITRKPLNLVVVVDHSGSMWDDQRLEKVKSGLHTLVQNLGEGDRLALVQFDDRVDVLVPFAETVNKTQLDQVINNLTPRGSTNLYDGLEQGFKLAATAFSSDRQNRVVFLSDGMATAGNTSQTDIIAMADRYVTDGIGLTTIGVGLSFDVSLMRGLAEHGAGNFYFLEDAAAASEVFNQELDYFVTPLALDVHVNATSGSGWQFGEVIGSTLWKSQTTAGSMAIPAVFVASRTSQGPEGGRRGGGSMLFIHLTPTGQNGPDGKVADLTLTYRLPGSSEIQTQTITLAYPNEPSEIPADTYLSTPEMAERYAMYNIFLGLRMATNAYDYNCAASTLNAVKTSAQTWNSTHEDPDIAADIQLIDLYLTNLRTYGGTGDTASGTCASDPYGDDYGDGYYGDDTYNGACMSAGGNSRGVVLIVLAVAFVVRRRRRA
ncbi:MAG TPA: VWA domain-containing protein [Kofleriaceae bacterium]|nr:VWA domain-containing protein [Kofleriaceae bacterium]